MQKAAAYIGELITTKKKLITENTNIKRTKKLVTDTIGLKRS